MSQHTASNVFFFFLRGVKNESMNLTLVGSLLLTGNERHRTGRVAGPSLIGCNNLDGVHFSTAHHCQDTGAGRGVTSEALVTHYMVKNGSMDHLTKFPGHRQPSPSTGHRHGDIHRRRCWRSCGNTKQLYFIEMHFKTCRDPLGQSKMIWMSLKM